MEGEELSHDDLDLECAKLARRLKVITRDDLRIVNLNNARAATD
jgi:hypothetical protein